MTDAVVFDLDGTLVDTPRAIVEAFTAAFAAMGVRARDAEAIRATIGLPLERAFSTLLDVPPDDGQVADGVRQYQVSFRELILPRAGGLIFPGVVAGLTALREQGFTLAVATSKYYASADALLTAAGLRHHFSIVVGADQVARPKPDPELGQLVMRRAGVPADRAVMVGDTTHDLLMAKAAGMRSIAVTYGVHSVQELLSADPTWLADTFDDVLTCVWAGYRSADGAGPPHPASGRAAERPFREVQVPMKDSTVMPELLDDRTYHIEFNGHLTNHAKHAVIALARLGAPAERIRSYYDGYARETPYGFPLEAPRPSEDAIPETDWTSFLGKRTCFSAYCDFFDRRQRDLGTDELLQRYLRTLVPGWVGSFTHAAIHLGWALDADHRWMTVEGLAYMAFSYVSCHPERSSTADSGGSRDETAVDSLLRIAGAWEVDRDALREWVEALVADTDAGVAAGIDPELVRSGLQYRQARVLAEGHPLIYRTPAWIDEQDTSASWEQLYYAVTLLYLARPGDFVLLHLITSLHGMEQIADRLPPDRRKDVVRCFWIGMLGIVFAEGDFPGRTELARLHQTYGDAVDADPTSVDGPGWAGIVARAIAEDEEHNPKMVYVLRRMWARTGRRSVYRAAAAHFTTTPELPKSFDEPPTR